MVQGLPVDGEGGRGVFGFAQQDGQLMIGLEIAGRQCDGMPVGGDGLVPSALGLMQIAEVEIRLGKGRRLPGRLLEGGAGLIVPAQLAQGNPQAVPEQRISRLRGEGLVDQRRGFPRKAVVQGQKSKIMQRVGLAGAQLQNFFI